MSDDTISLGLDGKNAYQSLNELAKSLSIWNSTLKNAIDMTIKYNKAGVESKVIVREQVGEFAQLEKTFVRTRGGQLHLQQQKEIVNGIQKARQAVKDQAKDAVQAEKDVMKALKERQRLARQFWAEAEKERAAERRAQRERERTGKASQRLGFMHTFASTFGYRFGAGPGFQAASDAGTGIGPIAGIALGSMTAMLAVNTIYAVKRAFQEGIREALEFNRQITLIRTISQDAQLSTDEWASSITRLSTAFGRSREEVAVGTYEAISNQVARGREAFDFMTRSMELSLVTGSTTRESVDAISSALNSYNLNAKKAGDISAALFRAVDLGRFTLSDLSGKLGMVTPTAAQLGVNFNEILAALTVLTRKGMSVDNAVTLLHNIMNQLIKPSKELSEVYHKWGVESGQAAIAAFSFGGVLAKLHEEAKGSATAIGEFMPEIRAMKGTFALASEGAQEYKKDLREINISSKDFAKALKEVNNSVAQIAAQDWQALKNFFSEWGDTIAEAYGIIRKAMTEDEQKTHAGQQAQQVRNRIANIKQNTVDDIEKYGREFLSQQAEITAKDNEQKRLAIEAEREHTEKLKSVLKSRLDGLSQIAQDKDSLANRLTRGGDFLDERTRTSENLATSRASKFLEAFGLTPEQMKKLMSFKGKNFKEFIEKHQIRGGQQANPVAALFRQMGFGVETSTDRIRNLQDRANRSLSMGNMEGWKKDLKQIDEILQNLYQKNLAFIAQKANSGDWFGFHFHKQNLVKINRAIEDNERVQRAREDAIAGQNAQRAEQLRTEAENTRASIDQIRKDEEYLFTKLKADDPRFRSASEAMGAFDFVAGNILQRANDIDPEKAQQIMVTLSQLRESFSHQVALQFKQDKVADLINQFIAEEKEARTVAQNTGIAQIAKMEEVRQAILTARGLPIDASPLTAIEANNAAIEKAKAKEELLNIRNKFGDISPIQRGDSDYQYGYRYIMGQKVGVSPAEIFGFGGDMPSNPGFTPPGPGGFSMRSSFVPQASTSGSQQTSQNTSNMSFGPFVINAPPSAAPQETAQQTYNLIERLIRRGTVKPFSGPR